MEAFSRFCLRESEIPVRVCIGSCRALLHLALESQGAADSARKASEEMISWCDWCELSGLLGVFCLSFYPSDGLFCFCEPFFLAS